MARELKVSVKTRDTNGVDRINEKVSKLNRDLKNSSNKFTIISCNLELINQHDVVEAMSYIIDFIREESIEKRDLWDRIIIYTEKCSDEFMQEISDLCSPFYDSVDIEDGYLSEYEIAIIINYKNAGEDFNTFDELLSFISGIIDICYTASETNEDMYERKDAIDMLIEEEDKRDAYYDITIRARNLDEESLTKFISNLCKGIN